ncbi:hypothetical protein ACFPRL_13660 [Pseudoclavibacter helvolus]
MSEERCGDTRQAHRRADREVDLTGDDDVHHSHREDPVDGRLDQDEKNVVDAQERSVWRGDGEPDD